MMYLHESPQPPISVSEAKIQRILQWGVLGPTHWWNHIKSIYQFHQKFGEIQHWMFYQTSTSVQWRIHSSWSGLEMLTLKNTEGYRKWWTLPRLSLVMTSPSSKEPYSHTFSRRQIILSKIRTSLATLSSHCYHHEESTETWESLPRLIVSCILDFGNGQFSNKLLAFTPLSSVVQVSCTSAEIAGGDCQCFQTG